jgi:hypothetical protein
MDVADLALSGERIAELRAWFDEDAPPRARLPAVGLRLKRLPDKHRRTLEAAYGGARVLPAVESALQEQAGIHAVALLILSARRRGARTGRLLLWAAQPKAHAADLARVRAGMTVDLGMAAAAYNARLPRTG